MSYAKYNRYGNKDKPIPPPSSLGNGDPRKNVLESVAVTTDGGAIEVTSRDQKEMLIRNNRITVLDVYGSWCGPCKSIKDPYDRLAKQYNREGECAIIREEVSLKLTDGVRGIPTFKFYRDGDYLGDKDVVGADIRRVEQTLRDLLS